MSEYRTNGGCEVYDGFRLITTADSPADAEQMVEVLNRLLRRRKEDVTPLSEAELEGIARQALNMAQTDRANHGWKTSIVLANYFAGEGLRRMESVERLIQEQLGKGWLDDPRRKDHASAVMRIATDAMPPDAFVIVTPSNFYRATAKMMALSAEEQKRQMDRSLDEGGERKAMVREGLLECTDSFTAVAQTPERVCVVMQAAGATQPETPQHLTQDEFDGRWKMFGVSEMMGYGKPRRANA